MPDQTIDSSFEERPKLLNEYEKLSPNHYKILAMSWAGWVFDFYDLILFTFLLIPISKEYNFSDLEMSYVLGSTLAATAIGGVIFWTLIGSIRPEAYPAIDNSDLFNRYIFIGTGPWILDADGFQSSYRTRCRW